MAAFAAKLASIPGIPELVPATVFLADGAPLGQMYNSRGHNDEIFHWINIPVFVQAEIRSLVNFCDRPRLRQNYSGYSSHNLINVSFLP